MGGDFWWGILAVVLGIMPACVFYLIVKDD